jgi:hypothetical protein
MEIVVLGGVFLMSNSNGMSSRKSMVEWRD